jgi:hypothetical protein
MILDGTIANADISATAAIDWTKISASSTISETELGYLDGVTSAIQTQLSGKQATVANVSDVEIGYLDGVTSSIQTQLDAKSTDSKTETLTNKTLTSPVINTPTGITKSDVGLGNVDNTADSNKPVSTATQTALDLKLALAGGTMIGALTLSADPSSSLHAATKQYVDNTASGVIAKPQVLGATTANIDATYNNGTAGVGATLTHNTNGAFPAESGGASGWAVGKGILVKNQTNKAQNGRYYVSNMGSVSTPYVLTRCTYCDEASEIPGAYIFVQDGTNAGTGWIQVVADPATFVVGTDNIDVFQFSGSGTITAGTGITVSGNEVSISTGAITSSLILDGTIVDGDINASAAIAQSKISGLTTDLAAKAPLASPTFTGTVTIPNGAALGTPASATLTNATGLPVATGIANLGTGVATFLTTPSSANLASMVTDEIGTGNLILSDIATNAQSASYTLALADKGKLVEISNASANTLTVPPSSSVDFPVGSQITVLQTGAGQTTITAGLGVTINGTPGLKLRAQWSSVTLIKRLTDTWVVVGDLTA